jgi:hypothetical protein
MKILTSIFLTALYLSFNSFCIGQNVILKGKVLDINTKEPIAYAVAEIKSLKTGTYTDSSGNFSLNIPEKNVNDSVEFSFLGYERKKLIIKNLGTKYTIELKQTYFKLKEVVVVPRKTKTIRIGITAKKPWRFQIANIFGGQYGHYIQNKNKKPGFVKAVSFYIAKPGFSNAPFRVRIYGRDKKNDCPGEDLLNENVIVSNSNGEGWFTVEISKYHIDFPTDGMYVMMEWVNSGDKYYYDLEQPIKSKDGKSEKKIKYHVYGQSIGNVYKQPDGGFWSRSMGDNWIRMNDYYKGYVNVMINADISFYVD